MVDFLFHTNHNPRQGKGKVLVKPGHFMNFNQVKKLFVFLIVWAGAKQSRSPGAEQPTQVRVYQLPVGVDGLASLA